MTGLYRCPPTDRPLRPASLSSFIVARQPTGPYALHQNGFKVPVHQQNVVCFPSEINRCEFVRFADNKACKHECTNLNSIYPNRKDCMTVKRLKQIVTIGCVAVVAALLMAGCGEHRLVSISMPETIDLKLGESTAIELTGTLKNGTEVTGDQLTQLLEHRGMTFESFAPSVASLDDTLRLTANSSGRTEINIYSRDNKLNCSAEVTVVSPLEGFEMDDIITTTDNNLVNPEYTTIPETADVGEVTVSVGDESIARVENNKIVPLKAGTTTVTITADNGVSKTVKLKVKQAPKELYADNLEVEIGETKTIHVYTDVSDPDTDNDNSLYEFENTDNSVCAVNVKGEVTGILVGTSKVKVTNSSGLETTMTVNVVPKTAHMTLTFGASEDTESTNENTENQPAEATDNADSSQDSVGGDE